MEERSRSDHPAWPLRAVLLAMLGAAFGLVFHWLIDGLEHPSESGDALWTAAAAFVAVSGLVFAMSLERRRWSWSAAFAAAGGAVAGFVAGWNGDPDKWGAGEGWQFFSALLAVAISVPLFQAWRDTGRPRPETGTVHAHAWTNLVLGAAAGAFVVVTMLLTLLLAELFHLIGIDLLRDRLDDGWFMVPLACSAFGGAVGLLRDRDQLLATLHKVGRAVLSVLAPALAFGLVLFVLALPVTGLQPLWDQTRATTPILLVCIVGAVLLVNAVAGNSADEEARSRPLRYAALALVPVMLPLAFVAAVSTAKRIGQYGLTPDRLWACVFVLAASSFAILYLHAVIRGRSEWPEALRRANIRLAAGLCLLALLLALPIVSFGAISTRDQLARLEAGKIAPSRFDWAALRFDFGPSGRAALERLAAGPDLVLRQRAREALKAGSRWAIGPVEPPAPEPSRPAPLNIRPEGAPSVPAALADLVYRTRQCQDDPCRLVFVEPKLAVLIPLGCPSCAALFFDGLPDGTWVQRPAMANATGGRGDPSPDLAKGRVEVRRVERRQLFVDGRPMGEVFD